MWTPTDDASVIDADGLPRHQPRPARHRNRALALVLMAQPQNDPNRKSFSMTYDMRMGSHDRKPR